MMLKVSGVAAQRFDGPTAMLVPLLSDGRIGPSDRGGLIKRAGIDFVRMIKEARLAPGEVPVHLIAVGSTEFYGPNRNGDGFRDRILAKYAHTFEKHGRFYRNHINKDPARSYGRIIKAAHVVPMHRIDLCVGLNGSEKTAAVNGGLVADKELEKLARGEDIPTSMACKVPFDVCSGCNNHARTREEYCDGFGHCKYGGLKHNITTTFDDGHQLHADNTEPTWFDDSHVYKPAERIAWTLGPLIELEKSAAAGVLGGAALAERIGLTAPADLLVDPTLPRRAAAQLKLAHMLADAEAAVLPGDSWLGACAAEVRPPVRDLPDVRSGPHELGRAMAALALEKVALPVRDWMALMMGREAAREAGDAVAAQLPGVFSRMVKDAEALGRQLGANPYDPGDAVPGARARAWAATLVADHGLGRKQAEARVVRASLRGVRVHPVRPSAEAIKEAADRGGAEKLARQYALYQLAFLGAVEERGDRDFPLTSALLVRQNSLA